LRMDLCDHARNLRSAAHLDGLPLTARWIMDRIISMEEK